jgi:transcription-repair coupling factor (superfamily II helicase)
MSEVAEKRLKAIKDFTELGSGFKVAMRDLEIRGAGNMMGSAQHGHMAAIGYDLYCRMLEDTIKLIKGDIEREPIDTTIELKVDAYIPDKYIEDVVQKIEIYKKIAAIDSKEEYYEVQEELEDRYSDIPPSVVTLMNIAYLKSIAKKVGIVEIKDKKDFVQIIFENKEKITEELVKGIMKDYFKAVIFKVEVKPVIIYNTKNILKGDIVAKLIELLEYMKSKI